MVAKRKTATKAKKKRASTAKTTKKKPAAKKAAKPVKKLAAAPAPAEIDEPDDQFEEEHEDRHDVAEGRRCQEYLTQVYFDKAREQYVATVLEFPNLQSSGLTAEDAVEDLWSRVDAQIEDREEAGKPVPEPVLNRRYPDVLNLPISQNLYRRLDMMSRQDRIPLEQLATELLSRGAFRDRDRGGRNRERDRGRDRDRGENRENRENREGRDNRDRSRNNDRRNQQNAGGQNRSKKRRGGKPRRDRNGEPDGNRREPDGNRLDYEPQNAGGSFLEYVRRLEQGGGGAGNKKNRRF